MTTVADQKLSLFVAAAICLGGSGCASIFKSAHGTARNDTTVVVSQTQAQAQPQAQTVPESDASEAQDDSEEVAPLAGIAVEQNDHVRKWISYFTEKDRERFDRFLRRGSKYKEVVESVLEESGVPAELYYLAMIESGYQTKATSRAKAAGVWQFIGATGKRYGLQNDYYVDERRDPIRATEAAAKYLRDLYNVFGSWHLALAAYNSGERRIMNAIMRGKSRDFWELCEKKVLPPETRDYVPKFMAAMAIGENPEKYGFKDIQEEKYPALESVEIPSPVRLADVARQSGVSYEELMKVNAHLKSGITPPSVRRYEIWVPAEKAELVTKAGANLTLLRVKGVRSRMVAEDSSGERKVHIVRRGENLGSIARHYSTSIAYLKQINDLRSNRIYAGMRLRLSAKSYRTATSSYRHRVQSGENLSTIARRYGLSVGALRRLNSIRGNNIYVGQNLRVGNPRM
jgi:membrane-bound lytic murein transglycosylase D